MITIPSRSGSAEAPLARLLAVDDLQRDRPATVDVVASELERQAIAKAYGLESIDAFAAHLTVTRGARGVVEAVGDVRAHITQICVVSLDPFDSEIVAPVTISFAPPAALPAALQADESGAAQISLDDDPPDPIEDGRIDLGAACLEFFSLALDPYPRKPGAEFAAPSEESQADDPASPFASLANLRNRRS